MNKKKPYTYTQTYTHSLAHMQHNTTADRHTQVIVHATFIMLVVSWLLLLLLLLLVVVVAEVLFLLLYCSPGYVFIARMGPHTNKSEQLKFLTLIGSLCALWLSYSQCVFFLYIHTHTHILNHSTTSSLVHVLIHFGHVVCDLVYYIVPIIY